MIHDRDKSAYTEDFISYDDPYARQPPNRLTGKEVVYGIAACMVALAAVVIFVVLGDAILGGVG